MVVGAELLAARWTFAGAILDEFDHAVMAECVAARSDDTVAKVGVADRTNGDFL